MPCGIRSRGTARGLLACLIRAYHTSSLACKRLLSTPMTQRSSIHPTYSSTPRPAHLLTTTTFPERARQDMPFSHLIPEKPPQPIGKSTGRCRERWEGESHYG
ncbi:hypothetical protein LY78DRAFT_382645 [Colletotrichum sublineola]|nr:hypothetical protein LY78DRAFT_382645 [Colletotrichum sublineola]